MNRLKFLTLLVIGLLSILLLAGCSTEKYQTRTEEALQQFHERLNAEDYEVIYEEAYSGLKEAQSKEEIITVFQEAREQLGRVLEVSDQRINVVRADPIFANVACVSKFEQGDATELFSFVDEDGIMKLNYYTITEGAIDLDAETGEALGEGSDKN